MTKSGAIIKSGISVGSAQGAGGTPTPPDVVDRYSSRVNENYKNKFVFCVSYKVNIYYVFISLLKIDMYVSQNRLTAQKSFFIKKQRQILCFSLGKVVTLQLILPLRG